MSLISSFVDKVRRPATARQARRPAAELVRPAAELVRPAAELVRPAAELVRPAAELVRPAAELVRPAAELVEAGADRMAERTIAFEHIAAQVVALVRAQLAATDPDNYHWMQDLYYDPSTSSGQAQSHAEGTGTLFAVTVSAGRLWRWPVALDRNDQVSVGEPVIVKVNFSVTNEAPAGRMSTLRETSDGRWLGASVLCTATVNKMGILDSRGLFDSFIARFKGDGSEYINLLHLGGGVSKIGVLRHIFRDDKLLVGIYELDKDDPVAVATARTLAADAVGYWGGSIEFRHFGEPTLLEVADGISLPVTTDGQLLGYSIARSADCAAWATCNLVFEQQRGLMTDKDKAVALELLGDEALVAQLAARLGDKNRTLEGAITYTVEEASGTVGSGTVDSGTVGSGTVASELRPVRQAHRPQLVVEPVETQLPAPELTFGELSRAVEGAEPIEYELDEAAVATLSDVVMERAVRPLVDERTGALRSDFGTLSRTVDDVMGAFTAQVAAATANLTALEARLEARLALLEQDDQTRYQQYDQAKPPQPVIKLGVRPRAIAGGSASSPAGAGKVTELAESEFARKTREKRQKA